MPPDDEYEPATQTVIDTINRVDGADLYNVTQTRGRTTIDFALGGGDELDLLSRATGGEFGSSIAVSTLHDEVVGATLRVGRLGLDRGDDASMATIEVQKVVKEANPPTSVSTFEEDAGIFVRLRGMRDTLTPTLRFDDNDIPHVVLNERVDVDEYMEWFARFWPMLDSRREDIVERVQELGKEDDIL